MFLNQRPQPKPSKALGNVCGHCDRALQEPHHYCCVACKVDSSLEAGQDVSSMLPKFMHTTFELSPESSPMKHLKVRSLWHFPKFKSTFMPWNVRELSHSVI